ncbi:MAG: hypothetical protein AD742_17530 [Methylibium sp. NZG]|nr:MAG: hypothetical protein AD742_17530 [Methylibium sp. NZG]
MNLDIGGKRPVDGDQVFLVGRPSGSAEPPFVLLHDAAKQKRAKRNIRSVGAVAVVASLGTGHFIEIAYPHWGTVWFCASKIRGVRALSPDELSNSSETVGSLVLFEHDPTPEDEHAGFLLFGMAADSVARLLTPAARA